jgi:hypothetical protein
MLRAMPFRWKRLDMGLLSCRSGRRRGQLAQPVPRDLTGRAQR